MLTRAYLESLPHWQATFAYRTEATVCLMQNVKGGFYWHAPDYEGTFAWGATYTFNVDSTRRAMGRDHLTLVAGTLPACLLEVPA